MRTDGLRHRKSKLESLGRSRCSSLSPASQLMSQSPGRVLWQIGLFPEPGHPAWFWPLWKIQALLLWPSSLRSRCKGAAHTWTLPRAGVLWVWGVFLSLCLCRAGERAVTWDWPLAPTVWPAKAVKQGFSKPGPHSLFLTMGFLAFFSSGVFCTN